MASRITLEDLEIENYINDLKERLKQSRFKVVYDEVPRMRTSNKEKATLLFSPIAWIKMTSLVATYSTEVEWHATVSRRSNTEFYVEDIIVFPHECSGASVVSDQKQYEEWLNGLDDETFKKLRMHGHSHVNMGVTPSGTFGVYHKGNDDESYRAKIVAGMPYISDPNNFYIFIIMNKSLKWSARIYDIANNVWFDTDHKDIELKIEGLDLRHFLKDANEKAKKSEAKTSPLSFSQSDLEYLKLYERY